MSPEVLKHYLDVLRGANVMSARLVLNGDAELSVTMGPDYPHETAEPAPGGWKIEVSDPEDPDPLQLGILDAPLAFDDDEVEP
jgi:hypothetical protein